MTLNEYSKLLENKTLRESLQSSEYNKWETLDTFEAYDFVCDCLDEMEEEHKRFLKAKYEAVKSGNYSVALDDGWTYWKNWENFLRNTGDMCSVDGPRKSTTETTVYLAHKTVGVRLYFPVLQTEDKYFPSVDAETGNVSWAKSPVQELRLVDAGDDEKRAYFLGERRCYSKPCRVDVYVYNCAVCGKRFHSLEEDGQSILCDECAKQYPQWKVQKPHAVVASENGWEITDNIDSKNVVDKYPNYKGAYFAVQRLKEEATDNIDEVVKGNKFALVCHCKDCESAFLIARGEIDYFLSHNLAVPKRCGACRAKRRPAEQSE